MRILVRLATLFSVLASLTLALQAQQTDRPKPGAPGQLPADARKIGQPSTSGQPVPKPLGLESAWTLRFILDELLKDNEKLEPLLAQMNPQEWVSKKGASDVYIQQWQTAHSQLREVVAASKMLAQRTESLPLALDDYFRLEALEYTSRSLQEAVTRYGDRFTADQLNGLIARNFSRRERFRDYIRDLAASSEVNFKLADEEAQRCRGIISKEPIKRAKK
jgi:hypothetical protein